LTVLLVLGPLSIPVNTVREGNRFLLLNNSVINFYDAFNSDVIKIQVKQKCRSFVSVYNILLHNIYYILEVIK